jgi:hypothetical protein
MKTFVTSCGTWKPSYLSGSSQMHEINKDG